MWPILLLALAIQTPPRGEPAPGDDRTPTIVVEGRLTRQALDAALKACLDRDCGPVDLANRALASANAAFVEGDYPGARALLERTSHRLLSRKAPPTALAAVFRAESVVAEHQGDATDAEGLGQRAIFALSKGGPELRAEEIATRLQQADRFARSGRTLEARNAYRSAAAIAERANLPDYRAAVELHAAFFDYRAGGGEQARRRLVALATTDAPIPDGIKTAASVLLARIARERGDDGPTDALLASLAHRGGAEPLLVYAPPLAVETPRTRDPFTAEMPIALADENSNQALEWVDVGYWVRPSGRVEDAEILRGSRGRAWTAPVMRAIAQRVYAPMAETSSDGTYKVVRISLGHALVVPKDSRIPKRAGAVVVTEMDLAREDRPPPPSTD